MRFRSPLCGSMGNRIIRGPCLITTIINFLSCRMENFSSVCLFIPQSVLLFVPSSPLRPIYGHIAKPDAQPARAETQPARPEAQPASPKAWLAGPQAWWDCAKGGMDRQMVRRKFGLMIMSQRDQNLYLHAFTLKCITHGPTDGGTKPHIEF